jgi:hypothetical protein
VRGAGVLGVDEMTARKCKVERESCDSDRLAADNRGFTILLLSRVLVRIDP